MLSGIDPSSGHAMAREHRRAPPAIGDRPLVDDAARPGRHVALLAARRRARLLEGHSALARRRHGRPPSAGSLGVSRSLAFKSVGARRTNQQRDCFYIPDKLYLSPRSIPEAT